VIASRFPILEELVMHEKTGLLVTPGQPQSLAESIVALIRNPQRRMEFGERGYVIARSKYDANSNTKAIMQVYDDVLAARGPMQDPKNFKVPVVKGAH
jgi:glycosyltransferase involved in cell wall biosynthesis